MVDILHRVGVVAPKEAVYAAITSPDRLAAWWTEDTKGDGGEGGVLKFQFVPGGFDMKVLETKPDEHVLWEVIDGPAEWIGTHVRWDLHTEDDYTIVMFSHEGWHEQVPFMNHCSTKWATYLMSMKQLVETGTGAPSPNDVQISNWH